MATKSAFAPRSITISVRLQRLGTQAMELVSDGLTWLLAASWPQKLTVAFGAAMVPLAMMGVARIFAGASAPQGLPAALEARAPLFAKAWGSRDLAFMAAFVRADQRKALQHWYNATPRPAAFADLDAADLAAETTTVEPLAEQGRSAVTVRVRVGSAAGSAASSGKALAATSRVIVGLQGKVSGSAQPAADPNEALQREVWTEIAGVWYFCPDESLDLRAARPAGSGVVVSKHMRH